MEKENSAKNENPEEKKKEVPFWARFLLYTAMGITLILILDTICNN